MSTLKRKPDAEPAAAASAQKRQRHAIQVPVPQRHRIVPQVLDPQLWRMRQMRLIGTPGNTTPVFAMVTARIVARMEAVEAGMRAGGNGESGPGAGRGMMRAPGRMAPRIPGRMGERMGQRPGEGQLVARRAFGSSISTPAQNTTKIKEEPTESPPTISSTPITAPPTPSTTPKTRTTRTRTKKSLILRLPVCLPPQLSTEKTISPSLSASPRTPRTPLPPTNATIVSSHPVIEIPDDAPLPSPIIRIPDDPLPSPRTIVTKTNDILTTVPLFDPMTEFTLRPRAVTSYAMPKKNGKWTTDKNPVSAETTRKKSTGKGIVSSIGKKGTLAAKKGAPSPKKSPQKKTPDKPIPGIVLDPSTPRRTPRFVIQIPPRVRDERMKAREERVKEVVDVIRKEREKAKGGGNEKAVEPAVVKEAAPPSTKDSEKETEKEAEKVEPKIKKEPASEPIPVAKKETVPTLVSRKESEPISLARKEPEPVPEPAPETIIEPVLPKETASVPEPAPEKAPEEKKDDDLSGFLFDLLAWKD